MTLPLRLVTSLSVLLVTAASLSAGAAAARPPASQPPAQPAAQPAAQPSSQPASRPAARPAARSAVALAPVPPALLPNARALKADNLFVDVDGRGHRVLRYESGLANVGAGPLEVRSNNARPCPPSRQHASQTVYHDRDRNGRFARARDTVTSRHSAGCMVFHPQHSHWHFEAAARYRLYKPTRQQPIVVTGRKMSFCLRDSQRAPRSWTDTRDYAEFYGACSQDAPQGISIGWVDIYQNFLPGQSLRLPDSLRNGVYCLRSTVDPRDELLETDDSDNTSIRAFALRGNRVLIRPTRLCT